MIVVNFKNYKFGEEALGLAKKIEKYKPIIAVPAINLSEVSKKTKLRVFSQHLDYHNKGKSTGFLIPEAVKKSGAVGTVLNHAEHRIPYGIIKKTIKRCNQTGLKVLASSSSVGEAKKLMKLKPWAIAFEDPRLIGTGKSITKTRANDVKKFAALFKKSKIIPLCGAGISSKEDVREVKRLGCKGVFVSSAVANSKSPERLFRG